MPILDRSEKSGSESYSKTEQPGRRAHGQEEKSGILLARAAIIQHGVIARPVKDAILHKLSAANQVVFDEVVPLERVKVAQKLTVCARAEPRPELLQRADPLTGMYDVADAVVPLIGRAEVCVAAKYRIMKKTGAPVCTDAPVCDHRRTPRPAKSAYY